MFDGYKIFLDKLFKNDVYSILYKKKFEKIMECYNIKMETEIKYPSITSSKSKNSINEKEDINNKMSSLNLNKNNPSELTMFQLEIFTIHIFKKIFSFCDVEDLKNVLFVSKKFHQIIENEKFWFNYFVNYFKLKNFSLIEIKVSDLFKNNRNWKQSVIENFLIERRKIDLVIKHLNRKLFFEGKKFKKK
jgi:hypothetical protein